MPNRYTNHPSHCSCDACIRAIFGSVRTPMGDETSLEKEDLISTGLPWYLSDIAITICILVWTVAMISLIYTLATILLPELPGSLNQDPCP